MPLLGGPLSAETPREVRESCFGYLEKPQIQVDTRISGEMSKKKAQASESSLRYMANR